MIQQQNSIRNQASGRTALDVMAAMFVDHIFELAAGPKDQEVNEGAYADDDRD